MKLYIIILFILLTSVKINAQSNGSISKLVIPNIPNLTIGDQVPDFEITKLINTDQKSLRMSDFKNQLLIIDFWATNCAGCVLALPKMESLQKQFGHKIKILPVTYQSAGLVSTFWRNNKHTKDLTLPSVVEDRLLLSYFKHDIFPHEVWVYKGKVIGITPAEYVDANNIEKILSGTAVDWPVKNDFYVFDGTKAALFNTDPNQVDVNSTFIKYVAISDYKEGVNATGLSGGSGIVRDIVKKTIRTFFLNQPIYTSYSLVMGTMQKKGSLIKPTPEMMVGANEIVWEVKDKSIYIYDKKYGYTEDWIRNNGICFESLNPDTGQTDPDVNRAIIEDLNRLLGLNVRWERRKEKVFVLVRTNKEDKLKSKKSIAYNLKQGDWAAKKYIQKGNLHQFRDSELPIAYRMNEIAGNPYVFDETGYKDKVDMDLNIPSWTDIAAIRKAIAPYGLNLKEEERMVDKLVFTEIDGGLLVKK